MRHIVYIYNRSRCCRQKCCVQPHDAPTGAPKPGRDQALAAKRNASSTQMVSLATLQSLYSFRPGIAYVLDALYLAPAGAVAGATDDAGRAAAPPSRRRTQGLAPLPASRAATTTPSGTRVHAHRARLGLRAAAGRRGRAVPLGGAAPPSTRGIHAGRRPRPRARLGRQDWCAICRDPGRGRPARGGGRGGGRRCGWPKGRGRPFA